MDADAVLHFGDVRWACAVLSGWAGAFLDVHEVRSAWKLQRNREPGFLLQGIIYYVFVSTI